MSRVLNLQQRRANNRAARKAYALEGKAVNVADWHPEESYLRGYFDVVDGKKVSTKNLPLWEKGVTLQERREQLWRYDPYMAGAWAAQRALAKGLNIAGYEGRQAPLDELEKWDRELLRREAADIKAIVERKEGLLRVIRQDFA